MNFQIYGDDSLIHNSSGTDEYNEDMLTFKLDGLRTFSTITILLPEEHGYSDGGNYYLTLCEVKIYAVPRPACDERQTNVTNGQTQIYNNSGKVIDHEYTVGTIIEVVCEEDLHLDGPPRFQCLATGKYNYPVPKCVEACVPIPKPSNGHVLPDLLLYEVNDSLKIVCDVGYETLKMDTIHCQNDGKWESPIPTCQRVYCLLPRKPEHGYYSLDGHTEITNVSISRLPYLTEVIGLCDTGFTSNHFQKRICNGDKTWSNQKTACTPVQCSHPRNISNVVYTFKNGSEIVPGTTFDYNTVLKVSCKIGYTLIGQTNRTCESDKTWSGKDPNCSVVTCDFPGKFDNGHYITRDYNTTEKNTLTPYVSGKLDFSSVIEAVCETTFLLKSSNSTRQCTSTGLWDGEKPVCNPIMCKWPLRLENGYYQASGSPTARGLPYNTTLIAICNETYKLSDNYKDRRCNENAVWDNSPAVCEPMCVLPAVENGQFINVLSTKFALGTTLRFTCKPGFITGSTNDTITCLQNHQWSATPVCQEACGPVPTPVNGHVVPDLSLYAVNDSITVICDVGYEIIKTDTTHCQSGGKWENPIPTCHRIQCLLPRKPDHGYYSVNGTAVDGPLVSKFPYMTEIIGLCNTGYVNTNPQRRICRNDSSWIDLETKCTPLQCSHPQNITNGVYTFQNGSQIFPKTVFNYNTVLTLSCKTGYTVLGQAERTCKSDKTWSGTEPHCAVVTCDFPGKFDNGHYVMRDHNVTNMNKLKPYLTGNLNFSAKIKAVCMTHYLLKSTNSIRQCTSGGIWDGDNPVCVHLMCEWPLKLDNGYYKASNGATTSGMPYNTTLTVSCNEMYRLSGNYRKRRCDEDAVWNNVPAVCEPICFLPTVANGKFSNVSSIHLPSGASVRLACDSGYRATSHTIICQGNHQWNVTPICQAQSGTSKNTVIYGVVSVVVVAIVALTTGICYCRFIKLRHRKSPDDQKFHLTNHEVTDSSDDADGIIRVDVRYKLC
ncbi:sushi, von Willebrand factor type A, EGF and pentraxin domain-containing protein 1-like [Mercenaria mercenaria]|uniref:sushi, von Willebrand factor type A, EGF and pentraxin domain-containing protein 1-like n=1 Tax=Mercenaria mercenaria TaxID=6596 RepID=UPI00234EE175|nr:sushi, von Willebrand factor type A, EGF and pentraxin domain-containing protein 1-like [Mercenaria mercenaria]